MEAMEANPVPGEQICGAKQDQHGMVLLCSGMGGTTLSAYAALLKERGVEMEVPQIEAGLRFFAIGADKGCSPHSCFNAPPPPPPLFNHRHHLDLLPQVISLHAIGWNSRASRRQRF